MCDEVLGLIPSNRKELAMERVFEFKFEDITEVFGSQFHAVCSEKHMN